MHVIHASEVKPLLRNLKFLINISSHRNEPVFDNKNKKIINSKTSKPRSSMKVRFCCLIMALLFSYCSTPENKAIVDTETSALSEGKLLMKRYCQSCHMLPDPKLLSKNIWQNDVLPEMAWYFGLFRDPSGNYVKMPSYVYEELSYMKNVPKNQLLTADQFAKIVNYISSHAGMSKTQAPKIFKPLTQFTAFTPAQDIPIPGVTLVKIIDQHLIVANASDSSINVTSITNQKAVESFMVGYPIHIERSDDRYNITYMGTFSPLDDSTGFMCQAKLEKQRFIKIDTLLTKLKRPVHSLMHDINTDGQKDIIISEFGSNVGSFIYYKNLGKNKFKKITLNPYPGSVISYIVDYNTDNLPDIINLMGQGDEGINVYINNGDDTFHRKEIISFPPTYGSTYFELVDFNGDKLPDILYANGDNGDYPLNPPELRNYHGVRIFLNKGNFKFQEALFIPINGVYKAMAYDFDLDGDLDICSVSHFADYYHSPQEGFVYLENNGELQFTQYSFSESKNAHWMTLDIGDVDHDGDTDIVLGAALSGIDIAPPEINALWEHKNIGYTVLKNNLKH